jgi:hypothetical protein
VCPGDALSYECCVASEPGIGSTIWKGSALAGQCPETGGEIIIRHRTFTQTRSCGNITGRGIGMEENGCYTSQLNVTVDSSLDNKTVECIYNNGTTIVIGTSSIEISNINGNIISLLNALNILLLIISLQYMTVTVRLHVRIHA